MRWWVPLLGLLLTGWAQAGPQADADAWLARVQYAAQHTSYQGTLVVNVGGAIGSSRVVHLAQGEASIERIDWLDGEPRSTLREHGEVTTLWPRAKVALIEPLRAQTRFPALLAGQEVAGVLRWYALKPGDASRVAGRDAEVMLLKARDALRYSQRLWADRRTGLLLRSEWLDADGQVLESTAFIELALGVPRGRAALVPVGKLGGWRVMRPPVEPTELAREGWAMTELPSGFVQVHCTRRVANPMAGGQEPNVVQAIYSDGVTHVSVFIEPAKAGRGVSEGASSQGVTHMLTHKQGSYWVTVMGDVPPATVALFAAGLVRKH
ncbi:MAG: MucB/RseB C-terminal domain-containing protein [Proteobacteria bacterium]|nr:MucB/RseB C-terminal domain-containing protein [Pseudomonadota bacterium]